MTELDYGSDLSALPGQPPDELFGVVTGRRALAESLARQLTCPAGGLFWASTKGLDLRQYVRARLGPTTLATLRARIAAQLREDERVVDVEVTLSFLAATHTLEVKVAVQSGEGPFSFVLSVTDARVSVFGFSES